MAGIITAPHLLTHCHPPACPLIGSLLTFTFFFSVWFIFVAVPSSLPFQKVMHTRKRHSELYHELNHSSKFHTIDRYSRDPAMSTFKVRSLPTCGIWDNCCNHPPPPPPHFYTTTNVPFFYCKVPPVKQEVPGGYGAAFPLGATLQAPGQYQWKCRYICHIYLYKNK